MPRTKQPSRLIARATGQGDAPDDSTRPAAVSLLDALRALDRELRVLTPAVEDGATLPPAQARALRELGDRPARSLAELADRTHTDPSSTSVVVQRLVEQGLVTRTPAADDRRRTELTVTSAGRIRLRREPATTEQRLAEAVAALGEQRAAAVARGLHTLAKALRGPPTDSVRAARPARIST